MPTATLTLRLDLQTLAYVEALAKRENKAPTACARDLLLESVTLRIKKEQRSEQHITEATVG